MKYKKRKTKKIKNLNKMILIIRKMNQDNHKIYKKIIRKKNKKI